jgi:hypothetical protein
MLKLLVYDSCTKLNCTCNVLICLDPMMTANGAPYIEGCLERAPQKLLCGSDSTYRHTISYDDVTLSENAPLGGLTPDDVKGLLCKGCITSFVEYRTSFIEDGLFSITSGTDVDTVVDGPFVVNANDTVHFYDGDSIAVTSIAGSVKIKHDLVLSTDAEQLLTFGTDTNVLATVAVENPVTGTGTVASPLGVAISNAPGNTISLLPSGIFFFRNCWRITNCYRY